MNVNKNFFFSKKQEVINYSHKKEHGSQMGFGVVLKSLVLQAIYRITHFKKWGQIGEH